MKIGISVYGELIDPAGVGLMYPKEDGYEHLAVSGWWDGYIVAYTDSVDSYVTCSVFLDRSGINTVSYNEVKNTAEKAIVVVTTRTFDNNIEIMQTFTFIKSKRWVAVEQVVKNIGTQTLTNVVLKRFSDFDVDGDYSDDYGDYDLARNLGIVWDIRYLGRATCVEPVAKQVSWEWNYTAWFDYYEYSTTDEPLPITPNYGEMYVLQAWELGELAPEESEIVSIVYAAEDSHTDLLAQIDEGLKFICPSSVGGETTPINIPTFKPELQAAWMWFFAIVLSLVLAGVYIKKRKRHRY